MENSLIEYTIPFSGMKLGKHTFDYKITETFFDAFKYSELKKGNLTAVVTIEKSETMMVANFQIEGNIILPCDVCLEDVTVEIAKKYRQIFKFSDDEDLKLKDEITSIKSSEFELNIAPFILEFINLSKPAKVKHENDSCDEKLLEELSKYLLVKTSEEPKVEEVDPRWNTLKKLKEK